MNIADLVLDDHDFADTAVMPVVAPDGSPTPAMITFAGPGHEAARAQDRRLNELRHFRSTSTRPRSLRQIEAENVAFIVERILGWTGIKRRDGEALVEVPFTPEVARMLLLDPRKGWLFAQCLEFLAAKGSFLRAADEPAATNL